MNFNMDETAQGLGFHSRLLKKDNSEDMYLSLQDKIMWCKSKYPLSYDDYKILISSPSCVMIEAYVYTEYGECGKLIGKAIGSADATQLVRFGTPESNQAFLTKLAYGSALTRAYTKAGFGLQFRGDSFEAELEALKKVREEELKNASLDMNSMNAQNDPEAKQEVADVLNDSVKKTSSTVGTTEDNAETEKPKREKKKARAKKDVSQIISPKAPEDAKTDEPDADAEAIKVETKTEADEASEKANMPESNEGETAFEEEPAEDNNNVEFSVAANETVEESAVSESVKNENETETTDEAISEKIDTAVENTDEKSEMNDESVSTSTETEDISQETEKQAEDIEEDELPFQDAEPVTKEDTMPHEMTLEEARNVKIDFGQYMNGSTVGEQEVKRVTNLLVIYQKGDDIQKHAVLVVARHDPRIKQLFISRGIPV